MKRCSFLLAILLAVFFSRTSFAAEIFFAPSRVAVSPGELIAMDVYLVSGEERINAAEGQLVFPDDLLTIVRINTGNSIFSFWPEEPSSHESGLVTFSGVIPGGFSSRERGLLFSVVFKATKSGTAALQITQGAVLRDDGTGSAVTVKFQGATIVIGETGKETTKQKESPPFVSSEPLDVTDDTELPESFAPLVGSDPELFGGRYFVVFSTTDKGAGVDHYEVKESLRQSGASAKWVRADSPYPLSDQKLEQYIFVKAIDTAGNERIVTLSPEHPRRFYQEPLRFVILIILLLLAIFAFKRSKK